MNKRYFQSFCGTFTIKPMEYKICCDRTAAFNTLSLEIVSEARERYRLLSCSYTAANTDYKMIVDFYNDIIRYLEHKVSTHDFSDFSIIQKLADFSEVCKKYGYNCTLVNKRFREGIYIENLKKDV